jgi:riboflavin kinase/FMN adenylyltransferase
MLHSRSLDEIHLQDAWVTIGSYDGVHLGHQAIVAKVVAGARSTGAPAVVVTFFPHPAVVLGKRREPFYLTSPQEKAELLGELGVDMVLTHPFNREVAGLSAEAFIRRLMDHLQMRHLCIGHDFALGRNREGDADRLRELGERFGYNLTVIPGVELDGQIVSSSRIRSYLLSGNVSSAARLLGRDYFLSGKVIPGDGRGRTIGIPTANLDIWEDRMVPKIGVYACYALVDRERHNAVVNIGVRPTFEQPDPHTHIEAHVLDFDEDLYGKQVRLEFVARLRDERRFSGIDTLIEQIHRDISAARHILSTG